MMYLEILKVMKPNLRVWDHVYHKLPANIVYFSA